MYRLFCLFQNVCETGVISVSRKLIFQQDKQLRICLIASTLYFSACVTYMVIVMVPVGLGVEEGQPQTLDGSEVSGGQPQTLPPILQQRYDLSLELPEIILQANENQFNFTGFKVFLLIQVQKDNF